LELNIRFINAGVECNHEPRNRGEKELLSIQIFLIVYVIWNVCVFMAMGRDKRQAKLHRRRIPEANLLLMGTVLGGIGLYLGMKYFHHKTAHSKFIVGAPLLIFVNFLVIGFFYYLGNAKLNLF